MSFRPESRIKNAIYVMAGIFAILYLAQHFVYKFKFNSIVAEELYPVLISETCDSANCEGRFLLKSSKKFLLIGNILRSHRVFDQTSGAELNPISRMRGVNQESWTTLKVYETLPGRTYEIRATKPKSTKMPYFSGLHPRESDDKGILAITEVSPTIAFVSGISLLFLLIFVFSAAYVGSANIAKHSREKFRILTLALTGVSASVAAFIGLGVFDALLPEGDFRSKLARISWVTAMTFPLLIRSGDVKPKRMVLRLVLVPSFIVSACLLGWPWLRGGVTWASFYTVIVILGSLSLLYQGHKLAASVWFLGIIDALKIFGVFHIPDSPPIYFNNVSALVSLIILTGNYGGFGTIALAGVAYRRFRRDLVLDAIQKSLESASGSNSSEKILEFKDILPDISLLTGARRITITISLPLGRPITQSYDATSDSTTVFDDGRIPGAVTLRSMLYGDSAMFESFDKFAERLRLSRNGNLDSAKYFCALPLRVNQSIIGTLMLTRFDDHRIEKEILMNPKQALGEDRENINLVSDRISRALATLIVTNMNSTSVLSRSLQLRMHQAIAESNSLYAFLENYVQILSLALNSRIMLHEKVAEKGVAIAQSGLTSDEWLIFTQNPFNLSSTAEPAYGPTVVAFRDCRSGYVKNVCEIFDRLHPTSKTIMSVLNARTIMAIPLQTSSTLFVITILGHERQGDLDPAMAAVVESTESLFVAAAEVMSQKSSVLALGKLTNRLIGDDEIRSKIVEAARQVTLPTTIGSPRESFLLLFDLIGSSHLNKGTEDKARSYGRFYDAVNEKCREVLGGTIRKTIGDAVIVTWDGSTSKLSELPQLNDKINSVVRYADNIAVEIGCKGARAILHYGQYFFGLVGTQTFGQIDVIGSGIDEVCKMEGVVKEMRVGGKRVRIAISKKAASHLSGNTVQSIANIDQVELMKSQEDKMAIHSIFSLEEDDHGHDNVA